MIRPATAIIIFSNTLAFMSMQTLFFWFILSKTVENTVIDKITLIEGLTRSVPEFENQLISFLNSENYQNITIRATEQYNLRTSNNIELAWTWMTPPFAVIIGFLVLSLITELYLTILEFRKLIPKSGERFDRIDLLILCSVFFAFSTETIFYFTVMHRSRAITDMDILQIIINSVNFNIQDIIAEEFPTTFSPIPY
jgi:hypothetical protein